MLGSMCIHKIQKTHYILIYVYIITLHQLQSTVYVHGFVNVPSMPYELQSLFKTELVLLLYEVLSVSVCLSLNWENWFGIVQTIKLLATDWMTKVQFPVGEHTFCHNAQSGSGTDKVSCPGQRHVFLYKWRSFTPNLVTHIHAVAVRCISDLYLWLHSDELSVCRIYGPLNRRRFVN